jgi:hypothetical protein
LPWTSCSIYATGGLPTVVVVDVGSFALSAALIAAIRTPARPEQLDAPMDGVSAWRGATGEWRAGMHLVGHDRALRVIFLSTGVGMLGEGTFSVGYTPLVIDVLQGGAAGAGALASAQAIGGSWPAPWWPAPRSRFHRGSCSPAA